MQDCCFTLNSRLKRRAKCLLLGMTVLQMLYFAGYLAVFLVRQHDLEATALRKYTIYRLNIIIVLFVGMVYFLFISLFKVQKNPNELISYLVLAVVLNLFFVYRLVQDAQNHTSLTSFELFLVITALLLIFLILLVLFASIGSLRESLYDDIFWQVGANQQRIELFRRRTLFKATLKISLFLNLLFANTLLFVCLGIWISPDPAT